MMTTTTNTPPVNFSGLLHAPDAEVGVYLLMGLLWNDLPYRLAIEAFELNPNREGHAHTKFLDAKGKILRDGEWRDVTMEFKLHSSGLIRDLEKHPGLTVDILVCWIHDAPSVEEYVDIVLELQSVYRSLAPERQAQIILSPDTTLSRKQEQSSMGELLDRFTDQSRTKVKVLLGVWPDVTVGTAELKFVRGATTIFRACKYSSEHLIISIPPPTVTLADIVQQFGGQELGTTVRIPLDELQNEDLLKLARLLDGNRRALSKDDDS